MSDSPYIPNLAVRPAPLPDTRATGHCGLFYALQDVETGALLTFAGPDGFPSVRLWPTLADAWCGRAAWCAQRYADVLVPPAHRDTARVVPLTPSHAQALRRMEAAARQYRLAASPSHRAGCRRVLRAIEGLPTATPWARAWEWLGRNPWAVLALLLGVAILRGLVALGPDPTAP